MMDGRNMTVKGILLSMLDEVSTKYQITDETLERYERMIHTAVREADGGSDA